MGARLLDLSDVAGSPGFTSSEQMPRVAVGRGSGLGRVGRGAAGGEGWGRGANGLRKERGAAGRALLGSVPRRSRARFGAGSCRSPAFSWAWACGVGRGSFPAHLHLPSLVFLQSALP